MSPFPKLRLLTSFEEILQHASQHIKCFMADMIAGPGCQVEATRRGVVNWASAPASAWAFFSSQEAPG